MTGFGGEGKGESDSRDWMKGDPIRKCRSRNVFDGGKSWMR